MLLLSVPIGAAETARSSAEAAYGTPVIDGQIDEVWDKTNYYVVKNSKRTGTEAYKGWFKVLWDEDNIYVLAKVYSDQLDDSAVDPWNHDSVDIYIDEDCARTSPYSKDDYQVRTNFNGFVSGNNYYDFKKVKTGTSQFENGFIAEMAFPLYTKKPMENLTVGFEVMMTSSAFLGTSIREYLWNTKSGWAWNNTNCFGNLTFKKTVNVCAFDEPEWVPPVVSTAVQQIAKAVEYSMTDNVTVNFDSKSYTYPLLLTNEYPCMALEDIAQAIGAELNGNTLTKDGVRIKYTESNRLAEQENGHIMLECAPSVYNGRLYVPVKSLVPTLTYTVHYNRFDKIMDIKTGTDYPDTETVIYARDYGAVGDGIHDDYKAINRAINAAIATGKPTRLELEANKTYLLGSRQDNRNLFLVENTQNLVIDGKGSELLIDKPTNSLMAIRNCTNVRVCNLSVDYKELPFTQGKITAVDPEKGTYRVVIEDGFPLPASDEWVKHYWKTGKQAGWSYATLQDPNEDHIKIITDVSNDHMYLDSINHIQGREYEVKTTEAHKSRLNDAEVGDRTVIILKFSAYDVGYETHEWSGNRDSMILVYGSGDVVFENLNMYAAWFQGFSIGMCWGRVRLNNVNIDVKPGRLTCTNADSVYCWRNRDGVVVENCTFGNNMDDQINTTGARVTVTQIINDYTYQINGESQQYTVGDELVFYNVNTHKMLSKAFIKNVTKINDASFILTLDRKIEGATASPTAGLYGLASTSVVNMDCSNQGTVVRNNTFKNGRRHAYITRSRNSIFENNNIIANAGGMCAENENWSATSGAEAPFPSNFTLRNNNFDSPNNIPPSCPIEVDFEGALLGSSMAIEGFLIENNTIKSDNARHVITVNCVDGLYMLNNTLISTGTLKSSTMPIKIANSNIAMIDGIDFDYKYNVNSVITMAGCIVDEDNIKNISIKGGNIAKPYVIR